MKQNVLIFITALLSFYLFTFLSFKTSVSYANDSSNITYEKINPDNKLRYKIKRFGEKFNLIRFNMFNKSKTVEYRVSLVENRAKEIIYLVDNSELDYLETAVSRFTTEVGLFSEELENSSDSIDTFKDHFKNYSKIFEVARDKFPAQTSQWLLLQQATDVTNVHLTGK